MTLEETLKRFEKHSECIQQTLISKEEAEAVCEWLRELKNYRMKAEYVISELKERERQLDIASEQEWIEGDELSRLDEVNALIGLIRETYGIYEETVEEVEADDER